jgi:3-deoxy-7-phosphoheptulonate synthase
MIIIMKPKASDEEIGKVKAIIEGKGLEVNLSRGDTYYIIGIVGDTSIIDPKKMQVLKGVDRVMKVQEPFKKANRIFKPENTVVDVQGSKRRANNRNCKESKGSRSKLLKRRSI